MKHITSKLLSLLLTLAMLLSMVPAAYAADDYESDGEYVTYSDGSTMDLGEFIDAVVANGYTYDGNGVTVKWSPVSGCYQLDSGNHYKTTQEDCVAESKQVTGNTPTVVNSYLAQYHLFKDVGNVTIKNVNFVFEPAQFSLCQNAGSAMPTTNAKTDYVGTWDAEHVKNAQLYLRNTGDTVISGCSFDGIVFTSFDNTGKTEVTDSTFVNVPDAYAIKDLGGSSVSITNCSFVDCSGAIMLNSNGARSASETVTVTDNSFANIGDRAILQLASAGDYTNTNFSLTNNTASNCGPVLRQLNSTAIEKVESAKGDLSSLLDNGGASKLYSDDTTAKPAEPTYVAKTADGKGYDSLEVALAAVTKDNPLTEVTEEAWPIATPVYYNGEFYATISEVLYDGIHKNGIITEGVASAAIYCRPNATLGTENAHPCFITDTVIYGNNASLQANWEPCVEHSDGAQYHILTKNITAAIYNLHNGAGFWGYRASDYTANLIMENCQNAHEIMFYGNQNDAQGATNITVKNCTFDLTGQSGINVICIIGAGNITVEDSQFTDANINLKNVNGGNNTVDIKNTTFKNTVSGNQNIRIRGFKEETKIEAAITDVSFRGVATENLEIGKESSGSISYTISGTSGTMNVYKQGETTATTETLTGSTVTGTNAVEPSYVAFIGGQGYATLDEAFKAAKDNDEIIISAGTYEMSELSKLANKTVTVSAAAGAKVEFDNAGAIGMGSASVTFKGITFDYMPNKNYTGLQHSSNMVYENCTFNGMVFLYGTSETFNSCTFNQTEAGAYNVWTYGAKNVAFNGCTFNCVGRCVLVYTEDKTAHTNLTVEDTTFIALAPAEGKAAIEIDTSLMTEGGATITVDAETKAEGFAEGSNSKNTLWNDKGNTEATNKNTIVVVDNETVYAPKTYVAEISGVGYETLAAAFAAAKDGDTITLLSNCSGDGIVVPANTFTTGLTVDFAGHTYTMNGTPVGSKGTENQVMQLLQGNTIIMENGSITVDPSVAAKARFIIQNYSNLTLNGMTLDGTNLKYTNPKYAQQIMYTLSNNNGTTVINGTTIIAAEENAIAFDVCGFANYSGADVTVKGDSRIEGDIEISSDKTGNRDLKFTLESGTVTGSLIASSGAEKVAVTKSDSVTLAAPDGYEWADNGSGNYSLTRSFYQDADDVWHIATANGLAQFADSVTRTNTYKDQQVVLDADIDMGNTEYMGAGTKDMLTKGKGEAGFEGTFDGQGHTIRNLTVTNDTSVNYTGLFYLLKGTVQDLTLDNARCSGNRVAVLAGAANSCTVQNVTIQNSEVYGIQKCGGLIGFIRGGCTVEIDNCEVRDVSIHGPAGEDGVWQAGGLVGYINTNTNATISNNAVSNITIQDAYKAYIESGKSETSQYSSHAFIGTIVNTAGTAGAYGEYVITLTGNSVEGDAGVYTNKTFPNNTFCGEYADCNSKTVDGMIYPTKLVIDGDEVTALPVAEVGSNQYKTLADAIAAAQSGEIVKLLGDLEELGSYGGFVGYDLTGKTLDLGGYTYSHRNFAHVFYGEGGTIKNGTILAMPNEGLTGYSSYALPIGWDDMPANNFTAEDLTLTGGVNVKNATGVTLKNLNVSGTAYYAVWLNEGATVTIESGKYTAGDVAAVGAAADATFGQSVLTITGGTIDANGKPLMLAYGGKLEVKGGAIENVSALTTGSGADPLVISAGTISGTGVSLETLAPYCAEGYVPKDNGDGSYTVEEAKPIEVWTGYTGTKVESYATIADAAANLGDNKWIVVGSDYTLTDNFMIPAGVYLDVAKNATLTVSENVTLTVAADAKRLGVRADATLVNNGTILVCGSNTTNGFAMLYGTFSGNALTVPEGCFLDNNGKNFFATAESDAVYEITFSDGSVKKTADSANIKGGNVTQIKLLGDVTKGGWTLDNSSVGPEVTLDLNGHTLSYDGANPYYATLNVYTKVTIKNGTVKYTGSKRGAIDLVGQGDLTIESDVVVDGGDAYGIFTSGTSKLTVNGTVEANGSYAIAGNGSVVGGNIDDCDIIVNAGASISAPNGIAIYHPELGTVTVNGGTISGHTGIEMCAGKLVVNDGSITSTGDNWDATGSQNAILDGAAISIINRNYPGGVPTAEINGGTIKAAGDGAQTVKAYDYTNNEVAEWTAAGNYVNISGGTFSSIPDNMDALCAEGHIPVKNEDGYTVRQGTYVAKIGNKGYATLAEAFAAAQDGETVTLLTNITVEGPKGLKLKTDASNVTLDLNGNSIDGSKVDMTYDVPAALTITVGNEDTTIGSLTIKNSSETEATVSAQLPLQVNASGYADEVKVVVEGDVKLNVLEGGTNAIYLKNSNIYITEANKDFYKNGGFQAVNNGETRIYESLGAAKTFNKTVTLLNDYTVSSALSIWSDWGDVTLDLNGHTYASTRKSGNMFELKTGAKLTFKNGTLKSAGATVIGMSYNDGTLTLEAVTVEAAGNFAVATLGTTTNNNITINNSTIKAPNGMGVYFPSTGKLTINGGSIEANTGVQICAGSLEITGNPTITATGTGEAITSGSIMDGAAVSIVGGRSGYGEIDTVTIDSGSFKSADGIDAIQAYGVSGTEKTDWADAKTKVGVSGGTFSTKVPEDLCADGYIPTTNDDGTYGVKEGSYVAAIGEVKYETLAEAIAAAQNGDTVKLIANVDLDAQIATGKAITIDGQGLYTIKATKSMPKAMFYRTTSAQGTLKFLNVTLDGGGVAKIFQNDGGAGETVFDGVTSTNGGGIAYGSGIHISGGGSHATIRNSTLTGSTGTESGNYWDANDLWVGGNVYVTVENSTIGTVFVNSAPSATATNGVVHGQLIITGEDTKITYLSGEEEAADKLDKFGNNGSLVKIDSGYVETIFDMGSYEIRGGTFKTEVKDEWCAFTYVPAGPDANGLYTVEKSDKDAAMFDANGELIDYADVEVAMLDSNAVTIKLINDATVENPYFVVYSGKTIDLNGKEMTLAGKLLGFGKVIDSTEGEGLLSVTDMAGSQLPKDNGYLPIKDGNGYRLYSYTFEVFKSSKTGLPYSKSDDGSAVTFAVAISFKNVEAWKTIANNDNGLGLSYTAKWSGIERVLRFKVATLKGIVNSKDAPTEADQLVYFSMTVNGFNKLSDGTVFTMTPTLTNAFYAQEIGTVEYTHKN